MSFEDNVKMHFDELSENDKEIVRYLQQNMADAINSSIIELGEATLSSKSTVLRLAKKLGFRGFSDLKFQLEQDYKADKIIPTDLKQQLHHDIDKTFEYSHQVNFQPLIEAIHDASNVYIYPTGFSQQNFAREFSNDLLIAGKKNYLLDGTTNFDRVTRKLNQNDFVIVVSLSGNTPLIKNAIKMLNFRKVPFCSITEFSRNYLSEHANYQLFYEASVIPTAEPGDKMSSMTSLPIILGILSRKYREFVLFDE